MIPVFLGLGSNLGDRHGYLDQAIDLLQPFVLDMRVSSVIETEPLYFSDQPLFLNQVIGGQTDLSPTELLRAIQHIEQTLGRTPSMRFGPREIDIDILSFGDRVMQTPDLMIPHPRLQERLFVLQPLAEIAPDWICPRTHQAIQDIIGLLVGGG
ncbi:MAG: 2-amino-4-hydroxy-6-hydroxymethyldihydropteridine diphosphokinase [Alphaproteobacteria bacterium]|nr:2-amino-4-hydroxy-6-hydroxymethyldihydropteridine diphosphokinase [Alphaproteobacteria bacterium]